MHIIFRQFLTELWPLIDLRILFMLNILWINWWISFKFCICIDIESSKFGWLNNIFRSFSTELWPFIDVEISFMLNFFGSIDGFL